MDVHSARQILRVEAFDTYETVRASYRRRLHESHPDRNPGPRAVDDTKRVIEAYRCLREQFAEADVPGVEPGHQSEHEVRGHDFPEGTDSVDITYAELVDDDTIAIAATDAEAFRDLVGVGHAIGDVTYIDRQNALLEVLLRTVANETLSLVVTLQGRSNGTTEAFLTMEPLDVGVTELPTIHGVASLVVHHLNYRHAFAT